MESKHTPGPWKSGSKVAPDGYGSIVWSPEYGTICSMTDEMVHHRENAALIAAAPDMYEALRACAAYVELYTANGVTSQPPRKFLVPDDDGPRPAVGYAEATVFAAAARAALAKAEGRA